MSDKISKSKKGILMDKEEIRAQAKSIVDDFIAALDAVEMPKGFGVRRDKSLRDPQEISEKRSESDDPKFKGRMLSNAPESDNDYIYANKKHW